MIEILCGILLLLLILSVLVFRALLRKERHHAEELTAEREAIEGEEDRLFGFLHDLGETTSTDGSENRVRRVIVDGAASVAGATGAALYLHDRASDKLVPTYCTKECPPLVALPERIIDRARTNPATLHSFMRLHAVAADEGLLGKCLQTGEPLVVADLVHAEEFNGSANAHQIGIPAMFAPLVHEGRTFGILAVAGGHPFSANDFSVFRSVADQSAFAVANAITHREVVEKRRLEAELHNAGEIQKVLFPKKNPELEDYHFAAVNQPARVLSGDYYDYVPIDETHYGIAIGDVSGKGIAASLVAAMCRSVLRAHAPDLHSPSQVLEQVNRVIFPDMREDMFVSSIYLILEKDSSRLIASRAGHPPILHWRKAENRLDVHEPKGMAMGLDAGNVFGRIIDDMTIEMATGDCMLIYTDGVFDTMDSKGFEYGAERLRRLFIEHAGLGADAFIQKLTHDLAEFQGKAPLADDITLIAIEKR